MLNLEYSRIASLSFKSPSKLSGVIRFYDRKEIKDCVAYLRVVTNPYDEAALRRIINFPARGIGDTTILKLAAIARKETLSLSSSRKRDAIKLSRSKEAHGNSGLSSLLIDLRKIVSTPERFFGDTV